MRTLVYMMWQTCGADRGKKIHQHIHKRRVLLVFLVLLAELHFQCIGNRNEANERERKCARSVDKDSTIKPRMIQAVNRGCADLSCIFMYTQTVRRRNELWWCTAVHEKCVFSVCVCVSRIMHTVSDALCTRLCAWRKMILKYGLWFCDLHIAIISHTYGDCRFRCFFIHSICFVLFCL